jgi:F0F1-type ATP synthase epsilon subunit
MADQQIIKVKVSDTETLHFDGQVDRISSFNEVGRFDVYPMHANFISIIRQEVILYQNNQKIKELKFEQAVMKVKQDSVHIFLGIEAFALEDAEKALNATSGNAPKK